MLYIMTSEKKMHTLFMQMKNDFNYLDISQDS